MVWLYETSIMLNLLSIFFSGMELVVCNQTQGKRVIQRRYGVFARRKSFLKLIPGFVVDHSV